MPVLARLRHVASVIVFVAASSCASPTLPLPPPALPTISIGATPDTFILRSDKGALPNALIVVINRNETLPRDARVDGTLADTEGSWELSLKAKAGDFIDISQESGTTRSPTTTMQLK